MKYAVYSSLIGTLLLAACATGTAPSSGDPPLRPPSDIPALTPPPAMDISWDGTLLSGTHTVTLATSLGDIVLELDADSAPKTVTNFVTLAKAGYYDGVTFHRVIPGFMIQGGDPSGNGTGGQSIFGDTFEDEIDPSSDWYAGTYERGTVAMANRGPDTNGSQFFIMDADYPLPASYTKFGRVLSGQETVTAIVNVDRNPANDMPLTPVTFTVTVTE